MQTLKLKLAALKNGSRPAVNNDETFCVPASLKSLSSSEMIGILSNKLFLKSSIKDESVLGIVSL